MKAKDNEQQTSGTPASQDDHRAHLVASMAAAFQFGFLCHEKGMNLEAALAKFYETMG